MTPERLKEIAERILARTYDWPDGCLIVEGGRGNATGHVRINTSTAGKNKSYWAHRIMYAFYHALDPDAMPEGLVICHQCDFGPCVAKDHLVGATQSQNMSEAHQRGRQPAQVYWNLKHFRERER